MAKSKKKSKGKGRVSKLAKRLKGKGKKKSKKGTQSGGACETPLFFFFFFLAMRSDFFSINLLAFVQESARARRKRPTPRSMRSRLPRQRDSFPFRLYSRLVRRDRVFFFNQFFLECFMLGIDRRAHRERARFSPIYWGGGGEGEQGMRCC